MPWEAVRRLRLDAAAVEAKAAGIAAHASQTRPLSDLPGDEVLLGAHLLEHFSGADELFVVQPARDDALEELHAGRTDPWGVDVRWYERRKRALTLAMLPREHHDRALELGCSTGALAADLATRCASVVAVDSSRSALRAAADRMAAAGLEDRVELQHRTVPHDWPPGRFDLVVVSELGYYLSPRDLDVLVERVEGSLDEDGVVLLCHWRHEVEGWPLTGPEVHERVLRTSPWRLLARHVEEDVELLLMSRRPTSGIT
jgi:SAM-dependent methyltransferase